MYNYSNLYVNSRATLYVSAKSKGKFLNSNSDLAIVAIQTNELSDYLTELLISYTQHLGMAL